MYRFLVNVPSQICRREGRFRAAIQIETLPQAVSEVKLVNSLRPDHLIINSAAIVCEQIHSGAVKGILARRPDGVI